MCGANIYTLADQIERNSVFIQTVSYEIIILNLDSGPDCRLIRNNWKWLHELSFFILVSQAAIAYSFLEWTLIQLFQFFGNCSLSFPDGEKALVTQSG